MPLWSCYDRCSRPERSDSGARKGNPRMDGIDGNLTITRRRLLRWGAVAGLAAPAFGAGEVMAGAGGWRLRVRGLVARPGNLAIGDLQRLGDQSVAAVLERAGTGEASRAVWTGVPLRAVLDRAGVREDAIAVVTRGDDGHQRTIALRDLPAAGPLLAWARDGEALSSAQGGPIRLIVPGWVAEASVKGVAGLELVDRLPRGRALSDPAERRLHPLREMPPRAVILTPGEDDVVPPGVRQIRGQAWSGYAPVERVAVTVDGGATWQDAEIVERAGPRGWVVFRLAWDARPGPATLAARATDAFGLTQPLDVPERARGFLHNAVIPVRVVTSWRGSRDG